MSWNHRVIQKRNQTVGKPESDHQSDYVYQIHEVFYEEDGSIHSWTIDPVSPMGESLAELAEDLEIFKQAFDKPALMEVEVGEKTDLIEVPGVNVSNR